MKKISLLLKVYVILCLFLFNSQAKGTMEVDEFLEGKNYTRGDYTGRFLYVSFLKEGFILEKRNERDPDLLGGAPPYEMDVKCYLMRDQNIIKKIDSLNDFQGFVYIDRAERAIEFVRLRSSENTYFLFRPEIMVEVFKRDSKNLGEDWIVGGASPDFFEKHKLKELEIKKEEGYFEISRYLVSFLWPGAEEYPRPPRLFRVVEKVYMDGQYHIEKEMVLSKIDFFDIPYPLEPK
ncbi:MAG: hypothetical protein ACE5EA_11140 [Nitrospirota bacterium]